MDPSICRSYVLVDRLGASGDMHLGMLAHAGRAKSSPAGIFINLRVLWAQKRLMYSLGWSLQLILAKSIIRRIILQKKNLFNCYKGIMDRNSKHYQVNEQKVHANNCNLYRSRKMNGMIGGKHSELINKLTKKLGEQQQKQNQEFTKSQVFQSSQKQLFCRISELQREETNLKKEMMRISQIAKNAKNSKIALEIKYQSLHKEYNKKLSLVEELTEKVNVLNELNTCLFKITDKFLHAFPNHQSNCQGLIQFISVVKNGIEVESKGDSTIGSLLTQLQSKLDNFKGTVDNMQSFQRKLMNNLAEAQLQSKTISERVSIMSGFNKEDIFSFKKEITEISDYFIPEPDDPSIMTYRNKMGLCSQVSSYTFFPDFSSRLSQAFKEISMVFEHHIHLLQTQKMEYQFTKNKKLIACQKFECQICQNYEKIVSQIFSIVRQAFKEIKFQFVKQTKQISDSSQIPFLI